MNRNLLTALVATLVAALAGCDNVLIPGGETEEAGMACLFDRDHDGFGTYFGIDAQGFQIDVRDFDAMDIEICRERNVAGEPLIWGRNDRLDPDDGNDCVGPSPTGWGTADLCPDNGDDDTTPQADDDDAADDDTSDDDDTTPTGDDDDSTPDVDPPDNGEPSTTVCWDANDDGGADSLPLEDAVMGAIYVFNSPDSGWFDGDSIQLDAESGSRWCFEVQCGQEYLVNGEVNGSGIGSPNQQYIAHNAPNSSTPRLWGRFETEGGSQLPWELQDNGANAGADVWVSVPDCD